ncbi:MAG: rmuC [Nevskia sp.]|nr:rmuC [Nevskia sp.]
MEYAGFLLITLFAVVALYFAIARLLGNRPAYPAEIEAFGREHNRLVEDLKIERESAKRLGTEAGRLAARVETLERELSSKEQQLRTQETTLQAEIVQLQQDLRGKTESLSQATAQLQHSERANAEMKQFLAEAQSRLSALFTEMAAKVFDERTQQAERNLKSNTEQSRADIENLLKPYAERLGEFRQRLDVVHGEETQERASLLGAVRELKTLNQDVAEQAAALTSVLKGSSKVRGDWGDLMLENVLSSSGLIEGQHYLRNKADASDKQPQPDVVITLPDERKIVIDCGLSLIAWQEAMNADAPAPREDALQRHAQALRHYINQLSGKNYPQQLGDSALEISIAFVPIEAALSAALGTDPSLQADAFERKVALASPNTLIALLAVVERLWVRDQIRQQAAEISAAGNKVLEALTPLLQVFEKTGKQLGLAHESFAEARRLLTESSQSLIPHAQRLASLGADNPARRDALVSEPQPSAEVVGLKNSSKRA